MLLPLPTSLAPHDLLHQALHGIRRELLQPFVHEPLQLRLQPCHRHELPQWLPLPGWGGALSSVGRGAFRLSEAAVLLLTVPGVSSSLASSSAQLTIMGLIFGTRPWMPPIMGATILIMAPSGRSAS